MTAILAIIGKEKTFHRVKAATKSRQCRIKDLF